MLLKMACTRHVLANIAPKARVKPMDMIQARAFKRKKLTHVSESKKDLDSGFHAVDSRFPVLDSW